jgi:hypothetical protein
VAFPFNKEASKYRKALTELSGNVKNFCARIDALLLTEPAATPEARVKRGMEIAALVNALELANDKVRRFTLGLSDRGQAAGRDGQLPAQPADRVVSRPERKTAAADRRDPP